VDDERAAEDLNDAELPDPDGDAPDIRIEHIETPPTTVLGTKGVRGGRSSGAPDAIHCAVNDALSPDELPCVNLGRFRRPCRRWW